MNKWMVAAYLRTNIVAYLRQIFFCRIFPFWYILEAGIFSLLQLHVTDGALQQNEMWMELLFSVWR